MINKKTLFTLCSSMLILAACGGDSKKLAHITPPAIEEPLPFAEYTGAWENKGTGHVWFFNDTELTTYNYNSFGCVKTDANILTQLTPIIEYLSLNDAKDTLTINTIGTSPLHFSLLSELPESCNDSNLLAVGDFEASFDYFWHTMNDYYAFFDIRDIQWQTVYEQYRPIVATLTSEEDFFELIDEIMTEFGDGHLSLANNNEFEASGERLNGFALEVLRSGLVDSEDYYQEAWENLLSFRKQVLEHLLQDNTLNAFENSDAIRWGSFNDNVGYMRIDRVQNMNDSGEQGNSPNIAEFIEIINQDMQTTDNIMTAALNDLNDSEALIIDLRFNGGGFDNVALKIASYFNDASRNIGTKKTHNNTHQSQTYALTLNESPIQAYTKPIYVITGKSTGSAGEVLAMALKALPNVTIIGEATNGSVSDSLEHILPNGWNLSLSHQAYYDHQGNLVENIGIMPDVAMPVYASQDILYFSDTPIDYVLQQFKSVTQAPQEDEIEQAFDEYFTPTHIPAISVAVIKDSNVIYSAAHGLANIEENIPATVDTPFNVGSISKAVLAAGIMQQVENGNISLADKLTDMNLSFNPNNPENEDNTMSLRHLVTHTSGIIDNNGYICSYFVEESNESLFHLFGGEGCPEQVPSDPGIFYRDGYFNENGLYHLNGVFNHDSDGFPDENYEYSNIGAGLAAYAIEQKLNINFAEVMTQDIFTPLNMKNTAWDHTQLSEQNAKAKQYTLSKEGSPIEIPEYSYPTFYDGDLNISTNDLAKYLITIINGGEFQGTRILSEATVADMISTKTDVLHENDAQGVFWHWQGPYLGHTGGDPGTAAIMHYNTVTKTGVIIMMNGEDGILGEDNVDEKLIPLFSTLYRYGLSQ